MFSSRLLSSKTSTTARTSIATFLRFPYIPRSVSSMSKMASASQVHLSLDHAGVYHVPQIPPESAKTGSHVLQENHDKNHMFFNEDGFHNHISHHVLTLFALGASPAEIQRAFEENNGMQRPHFPIESQIVHDMSDPAKFRKYLGDEKYFHSYVAFFESEMDKKGWQTVVNEYLLSRDERADDLLVRMFSGFLHPLIHLGFGVEFQQPAIISEALAQAAVHTNWPGDFLLGAEKEATSAATQPPKTLVQLIHETRANETIRASAQWNDGNKLRDGVLKRAAAEMTSLAAQFRVKPEELEEKTAEMINACAYFMGAAQWPGKEVKFDFFYMHSVNCSIFFSAFLGQEWMRTEDKVRLLEWKGRMDVAMYASRGCPELKLEEVTEYAAKKEWTWEEIVREVDRMEDDGHVAKLIRALRNGEEKCRKFEGREGFLINGKMWLQLGRMTVDSVQGLRGENRKWVRNAGFAKAWEKVPDRAKL